MRWESGNRFESSEICALNRSTRNRIEWYCTVLYCTVEVMYTLVYSTCTTPTRTLHYNIMYISVWYSAALQERNCTVLMEAKGVCAQEKSLTELDGRAGQCLKTYIAERRLCAYSDGTALQHCTQSHASFSRT